MKFNSVTSRALADWFQLCDIAISVPVSVFKSCLLMSAIVHIILTLKIKFCLLFHILCIFISLMFILKFRMAYEKKSFVTYCANNSISAPEKL